MSYMRNTYIMQKDTFYQLVTRVLSNEASNEEREQLNVLLELPENRKVFDWIKAKWDNKADRSIIQFDYNRGLKLLRAKIKKAEVSNKGLVKNWMKIAAGIAIVIGTSIGAFWYVNQVDQKELYISVQTRSGEKQSIYLPDGSKVFLNADTKISYPKVFNKNQRKIVLEGEAFFDVIRREDQPFIVQSANIETSVLGTSFNITAFPKELVSVKVESGKVKVSSLGNNQSVLLSKGEGVLFHPRLKKFTSLDSTKVYTTWRFNQLQFKEEQLDMAIRKLERWYNVKIECNNPKLLDRIIRGNYQDEKLENILQDWQFIFNLNYSIRNDTIILQ